jgi:hypothetical protein
MSSIRTKSADFPRTVLPMEFSFKSRSSTILIDELHRMEKEEQELNTLNNRFATYLNKIINLGDMNVKLRRQIDDIHQTYKENGKENAPIGRNLLETEFNNIRRQLNTELQKLIFVRTQFQRADYDKKYYKNQLKFFSTSDQLATVQQQFDANLYELNLLKEQHAKQIEELQVIKLHLISIHLISSTSLEDKDLILWITCLTLFLFFQSYKKQYNEYTTKLIEYTNEYNTIISERIQSENSLCTLQEQISFEREYNCRCKEEFEYLDKIQYDLHDRFTKEEFAKIIEKIRLEFIIINRMKAFLSFSLDKIMKNIMKFNYRNWNYYMKVNSRQLKRIFRKINKKKFNH